MIALLLRKFKLKKKQVRDSVATEHLYDQALAMIEDVVFFTSLLIV